MKHSWKKFFLFRWRPVSFPVLNAFWYKLVAGKNTLSVTIVIIDSDKALVNQCNEEIEINQWTSNTKSITKCFIFDLSLRDLSILYIHFNCTWKSKCSKGYCFYIIFFDIFYYFRRFFCNQVVVNPDPTFVIVWNGNIVEKIKGHCQNHKLKCHQVYQSIPTILICF